MQRFLWFLPTVLLLAADRLTKFWAVSSLPVNVPQPLIGQAIRLTYMQNTGGSFGLLPGKAALFIAASAVVSVALLVLLLLRRVRGAWLRLGLSVILAGAIGNLIDRAAYGYVIDFFEIRGFPVFNLADSCITVGAVLVIIGVLWGGERDRS